MAPARSRLETNSDQYTVELDSIDLHYVHVEGKGPNPMPLLLTHGWPSSFADFRQIIPC